MDLFILSRKEETVRYDEASGFLVAAESHAQARDFVFEKCGGKGGKNDIGGREAPAIWLWPNSSSCRMVGICTLPLKKPKILLRDFYEA